MPGTSEQEAEQLLRRGLELLGLPLADGPVAQLVRYCLELEKWNRKVNLIAKNTPLPEIIDKHFLDSLTLVPILDRLLPKGGTLLDVGSGAGFPGLPVKIARPSSWQITLLEPRERRVIFLRHVIRTLAVTRIAVEPSRIEEGRVTGEYQLITGRAVADVPSFLIMVEILATSKTYVICMQGEGGRQGLGQGDRVGAFICVGVEETRLPFSRAPRFLLLFRRAD
ncbi:MAG TPA: 16S rRNA (guanine(527)-N(7))-methyltransferase RsmG [Desulfobulbaceae bacterium]|nr:16S rRNA (guanine(527)-N(7))-methyltransferase RsmG [Desulfobulbaceae bacterium]